MSETTQRERDLLRLGWDRNGPLCRAINDADRLAAIERQVRALIAEQRVVTTNELRAILDQQEGDQPFPASRSA